MSNLIKPKVSVVVPFYNEELNAPILSKQIEAVFAEIPDCEYECLFVNDGSTDGTRETLDQLAKSHPQVRPIHLRKHRGQSAALIAGMRAAKGEFILTLDGDLQNDPCDFPKLLELLEQYDCVYGVRVNRQDTWIRRTSSRIANAIRNAILHDGIQDSGCGTKGFRRVCIGHFLPFDGVHRFFAVLVRNAGLSIVECPVTHHPRKHGESKYGIHNRLWRGLYDLIGVAWLRRRYVTFEIEPPSTHEGPSPHEET